RRLSLSFMERRRLLAYVHRKLQRMIDHSV
ncbi:MAG: hypothetical protein QOF64_1077, partial [Candidatus Binatota bacterium]|nr:hypothetical protein [Candidatus Binatota bacterium]